MVLDDRVLDEPARGTFVPTEARSIGVVFQDLLLFRSLDVADNVAFGLRAAGPRRGARPGRRRSPGWHGSGWTTERALPCGSSPGERRSGWPSPARWRPRLARCSWTSRWRPSTPRCAGRCGASSATTSAAHAGPCVLVTHDPLDAAVLADRVVVLEDGRVTASGALSRPGGPAAHRMGGRARRHQPPARDGSGDDPRAGRRGRASSSSTPPGDGPVLAAIRPAAVALHRQRPEGSARNVWEGTVAAVEGFGERVRVQVEGPVPLVGEVTTAAVAELGLRPGERGVGQREGHRGVGVPRLNHRCGGARPRRGCSTLAGLPGRPNLDASDRRRWWGCFAALTVAISAWAWSRRSWPATTRGRTPCEARRWCAARCRDPGTGGVPAGAEHLHQGRGAGGVPAGGPRWAASTRSAPDARVRAGLRRRAGHRAGADVPVPEPAHLLRGGGVADAARHRRRGCSACGW